jgi:hypothetical protein
MLRKVGSRRSTHAFHPQQEIGATDFMLGAAH